MKSTRQKESLCKTFAYVSQWTSFSFNQMESNFDPVHVGKSGLNTAEKSCHKVRELDSQERSGFTCRSLYCGQWTSNGFKGRVNDFTVLVTRFQQRIPAESCWKPTY